MKNIVLLCSNGMSTSLLVSKMKEYADSINYSCTITAYAVAKLDNIKDAADVIFLGPQIRFQLNSVKEKVSIPVEVIDMTAYGMMDGAKVVKRAMEILGD